MLLLYHLEYKNQIVMEKHMNKLNKVKWSHHYTFNIIYTMLCHINLFENFLDKKIIKIKKKYHYKEIKIKLNF